MQPHLHPSVLIHTDQILRNLEIPHTLIQLLKPFERAEQDIQILRKGDILDITQPHRYVFDIHLCGVVGIAKFLAEFVVEVFGVDYVVLALPPLEELEVLLELCQVVEGQDVLLELLVCEVVYEEAVAPVLQLEGAAGFLLAPALLLEGRRLVRLRVLASHSNYKIPKYQIPQTFCRPLSPGPTLSPISTQPTATCPHALT